MASEPSFWERLSDALPWNRGKAEERAELERAIHQMGSEPAPPAASAAEAMAEMRRESAAKRAASTPEPAPEARTPSGPENTDLREKWRGTAPGRPSPDSVEDLKRRKGG